MTISDVSTSTSSVDNLQPVRANCQELPKRKCFILSNRVGVAIKRSDNRWISISSELWCNLSHAVNFRLHLQLFSWVLFLLPQNGFTPLGDFLRSFCRRRCCCWTRSRQALRWDNKRPVQSCEMQAQMQEETEWGQKQHLAVRTSWLTHIKEMFFSFFVHWKAKIRQHAVSG